MPGSPSIVADALAPLGLTELEAATLLDRVDVKYVVRRDDLEPLVARLRGSHRVLEIGGRRAFAYRTTYFDTPDLRAFRDHLQQRRRRYKCRAREYVDSGLCTFEVKLKGPRGRTVKHRVLHGTRPDALGEPALGFLRECVGAAYGFEPAGPLHPVLVVDFTRVTLAAPALGERLTCDFDVILRAPDGSAGRLAEDRVIVETKSQSGLALADRALRSLGARPEPRCSKYCLGVGLTHPELKTNLLRPLLRRHFRVLPAAAAALALGPAAPAVAEVPRIDVRTAGPIRDAPRTAARLTVGGRSHRVGIELRGETSQRAAKKSYAFEAERRLRPLGMPAERDWVLNAAARDPSLLRDVLAHAAARRLGLAASRTRHVQLRINGRARGVYVLMERAELSRRRVQGDALLELTDPVKLDRGEEFFASATGLAVRYVEPDEAGKAPARAARRAVTALESALAGPEWRRHLDERAAVDYLLLSELFGNSDAFQASTYVHMRTDGLLVLGPVWDFDRSAGGWVPAAYKPAEGWLATDRRWGRALLADPGFRATLAARWQAQRASLMAFLLRSADRHARALRGPARRNRARWPKTTPHPVAVGALKDWLGRRAAWLDGALR